MVWAPTAPSYQYDSQGNVTPTADAPTQTAGKAKLPPPDGALSTCQRCTNEVMYNGNRGRWEHTGHGDWECFQPRSSA